MKPQDIKENNQEDRSAETPLSIITSELIAKFSIGKFILISSKKESKDGKIIVEKVKESFGPLEILIAEGHKAVIDFKQSCTELLKNASLSYNLKLKELLVNERRLNKSKNAHNIENRFSFTTKLIFELENEKKSDIEWDFYDFIFTKEHINEMKEFLRVRFELFDELRSQIDLSISILEINAYKYARFKLKQPDGKRLLWELAFALENEPTLIAIAPDDRDLFERELFNFFGVRYENRGKIISNLFAKDKKTPVSQGLKRLRNTFTGLTKDQLMRLKKTGESKE